MPRKNRFYAADTKVPIEKSRAEVERLIHKHGCSQYLTGIDYATGRARIQFKANSDRIVRIEMEIPKQDQAARVKWRGFVLVLKAKLESVAQKITTFDDEFMPHIVMPDDRTVSQHVTPAIAIAYKTGKLPPFMGDDVRFLPDGKP